ncbi:G-type lectin S-receptor-like serine/threonine-protein kinase LECRK1 [Camellia lanceoleosa]|uniref:G-type lectin S-receptor-like serine/threonine-protein kinase LECRK1 n=1 Tax=Camellia lanceoleosa TaxID=1840588 RepID=A0ACC0FD51_9ERIC|nr:G-type lectin S-receptor-like serine/threonine-protein kinase LECRK1 [Camellia lanceoleosa]
MSSIVVVVLLIFFILFAAVEAQKKTSNLISLGSFLSPISKPNSWLSPSGLFAFGFYLERNGFAVRIWIIGNPTNTVVWTANRDYPPVSSNSTIEFTRDGIELAIADFITPSRVLSASMLDSGNFVIYNNNSSVIWQSFDFPTDTILGNQTLFHGPRLVSSASSSFDHSSGHYRLQMQVDGNLVAFPINCFNSDFAYASASASSLLGANGYYNLTITISSLRLLTLAKASASSASPLVIIYRATLDDDGIFRLYSHRFVSYNTSSNMLIEWSMLQEHCKVYGFCGFNNYCSITTGTQADCYCYPGFVLVNPSKKFLGCYMNFTEQHCRNKEGFGLVNITTLEKLRWFGLAYSVVPANNKEDCKKSFLEDCRCGAECMHRVHKYKNLSDNAKFGLSIDEFSLRSFSYNELEEATQGFREEMDKGSFGTVYKGTLVSGGGNKNIVAVKRLENIVKEEGDMEFQFQIENIEVNVSNEDEMILSTWAYKCFVGGELHKLLVGDEEMRVDSKTVERMVKVGLLCVQDDLGMRPSIKDVILILEGTMNISVPPPPHPISLQ